VKGKSYASAVLSTTNLPPRKADVPRQGKKAGLFGCRFDAIGKPTACGRAKVKEGSGKLGIVVKK
jgi:hypothetical protein